MHFDLWHHIIPHIESILTSEPIQSTKQKTPRARGRANKIPQPFIDNVVKSSYVLQVPSGPTHTFTPFLKFPWYHYVFRLICHIWPLRTITKSFNPPPPQKWKDKSLSLTRPWMLIMYVFLSLFFIKTTRLVLSLYPQNLMHL